MAKPFKYRGGWRMQVSLKNGTRPHKDFDNYQDAKNWGAQVDPAPHEAELSPPFQNLEPLMRNGTAIQIEPVPIEAPGELRVAFKSLGTGNFSEIEFCGGKRRIGLPKAVVAPEVRQAGVDADTCSRSNHQSVRAGNDVGSTFEDVV